MEDGWIDGWVRWRRGGWIDRQLTEKGWVEGGWIDEELIEKRWVDGWTGYFSSPKYD